MVKNALHVDDIRASLMSTIKSGLRRKHDLVLYSGADRVTICILGFNQLSERKGLMLYEFFPLLDKDFNQDTYYVNCQEWKKPDLICIPSLSCVIFASHLTDVEEIFLITC